MPEVKNLKYILEAVMLTSILVRDYLLNYARSLIYTTSLSYANIIAADCSFDFLVDGTTERVSCIPNYFSLSEGLFMQLSNDVLDLSAYLVNSLLHLLKSQNIPPTLVSLPSHLHTSNSTSNQSPIIPVLTPHPRPLSAYLFSLGMNVRPITWPTVPKDKGRVRVCLHAGNTREEVDKLVSAIIQWAGEYTPMVLARDFQSKL